MLMKPGCIKPQSQEGVYLFQRQEDISVLYLIFTERFKFIFSFPKPIFYYKNAARLSLFQLCIHVTSGSYLSSAEC